MPRTKRSPNGYGRKSQSTVRRCRLPASGGGLAPRRTTARVICCSSVRKTGSRSLAEDDERLRSPVSLSLVLDKSGSMAGAKLALVQCTLAYYCIVYSIL